MSLDQETLLTLREEYETATARAKTELDRLRKIQDEFEEATSDHAYWSDRAEALNVLLAQDGPQPVAKFATFGEE